MWEDPIVEEVRKIRQEIEAESSDNFEKIFSSAIEVQRQYGDKLVSRPRKLTNEEEVLPSLSRG